MKGIQRRTPNILTKVQMYGMLPPVFAMYKGLSRPVNRIHYTLGESRLYALQVMDQRCEIAEMQAQQYYKGDTTKRSRSHAGRLQTRTWRVTHVHARRVKDCNTAGRGPCSYATTPRRNKQQKKRGGTYATRERIVSKSRNEQGGGRRSPTPANGN